MTDGATAVLAALETLSDMDAESILSWHCPHTARSAILPGELTHPGDLVGNLESRAR